MARKKYTIYNPLKPPSQGGKVYGYASSHKEAQIKIKKRKGLVYG